jgi:Flp pilus assembly protein TadG
MRGGRVLRSPRERGAAAVEFALVVPILLLVMFGIVDYGLWFGDSLNVRQGVDEAARRAVVEDFGSCSSGDETEKTACLVEQEVGALTGTVYVNVSVSGPGSSTTDEWAKGATLRVCAMVRADGLTGLTPMPDDGLLRAKVHKRVEAKGGSTTDPVAETPPSGADWAWCT